MSLPDNYREATGDERCGNCGFLETIKKRTFNQLTVYIPYCKRWKATVRRQDTCNSWKPDA